jgi:hemoglobin
MKRLTTFVLAVLVCSSLAAAQHMESPSLYKRLGGYDALAAVTDDFIGRLAGDKSLQRFFAGHSKDSLGRIRQLIVDQLCAATGGPCIYIGRDMKTAHQGMNITDADWTTAVVHLNATLDKFKVPGKERDEVLGAISSFKNDIVEQRPKAVEKK